MNHIDDSDDSDEAAAAAAAWADQDFSRHPVPSRAEQERLLARLPEVDPDASIMVSRSLRLPPDLERQVKAVAKAEGVSGSEWIRRAIQRALTGNDAQQISLDAAINALRNLPRAV